MITQQSYKKKEHPRSICICGHTGDGANSEHYDHLPVDPDVAGGLGSCKVKDCPCQHFIYKKTIVNQYQK